MENQKTVLIIDDDVDLVEVMRVTLESPERRIVSAYTTEEGMKLARQEAPDLIILDAMFGDHARTRGFDLAVQIKKDEKLSAVPILMLSSVNRNYPGFGFGNHGGNEYLPVDDFMDKPAQPEALIDKVESLLLRKTSQWVNWPDTVQ